MVQSTGLDDHPREERSANFLIYLSPLSQVCQKFEVGFGAEEIVAFFSFFFLQKKKKKQASARQTSEG